MYNMISFVVTRTLLGLGVTLAKSAGSAMAEKEALSGHVSGKTNGRPLVLPELYTGLGDFLQWIDHFENVAAVNDWNDEAKLLWLKARLAGRAHTAFKRFAVTTYSDAVEALRKRFEPESKRELHNVEFQTRRKDKKEGWADFAEDLRTLADKAYPDLPVEARDRLSLNRYLDQIEDTQMNFGVKQSRPTNLDEAVTTTLQLESYRYPTSMKVSQVTSDERHSTQPEVMVGGVGGGSEPLPVSSMLQAILTRLEKLEKTNSAPDHRQQGGGDTRANKPQVKRGNRGDHDQPVICYRCGKHGHYARGCAESRTGNQAAGKG